MQWLYSFLNIAVSGITVFFDTIMWPFSQFPPIVGLVIVSAIGGVVFLKLFGMTSNQTAIKRIKNKIKANLFAVVIYRDSFLTSFGSIMKMIGYNFLYMRYVLVPLVVLGAVFVVMYGQLDIRYGKQPLAVNEPVTVSLHVKPETDLYDLSLKVDDGMRIDTPALRIKQHNEVNWVITPVKDGMHDIIITNGDEQVCRMPVISGNSNTKKIPTGSYRSWCDRLLYPGLPQVDSSSPVVSLTVDYAGAEQQFFAWKLHWLVIFLIVSLIAGLLSKRFINVEI